MVNKNFIEELKSILTSELSIEDKKDAILQYHSNDIAQMLDVLTVEERDILFSILDNDEIAEILSYSDDVGEIIDDLDIEQVADLVELMEVDDAIDLLEDLDEDVRDELVAHIDEDMMEEIDAITKYDEDMLGSKMTNNYITINIEDNVKTATKKVINQAAENDNITTIYVVDSEEKLLGSLELRDLIIAREHDDLSKIIKTNYPSFNATSYVEDSISHLIDYALPSYPIVDDENHLIGVITSEDVIEVVDDELADDYAKLGGLTEEEEINDSVFSSVRKRLPWLITLLILGLVQAIGMTRFEKVVATLPIIIFFQTMVLGMAGNTGTQSLAVTIRLLSDKDDSKNKLTKALFKELRIGFSNGLVLATLAFLCVLGFLYFTNQGVAEEFFVLNDCLKGAAIVACSLLIAMTISSFVGAMIPILFSKIKIDPAVASGPFITTINDITALLTYYGLAIIFFSIML